MRVKKRDAGGTVKIVISGNLLRKSICNLPFEEKEDTLAHDLTLRIRRQNKHDVMSKINNELQLIGST